MFLALDTSTLTLSLALAEGRGADVRILEEVTIGPPKKQSELLPGAIGELLARHGVPLASLEGIAVGLGPGSFTGLRIGLSSAKALCYGAGVKLVGVPSFAAAALEGPEARPQFVCAVARTNEVYVGTFVRRGLTVERISPEDAMSPAELGARVRETPDAVLIGPAVAPTRAAFLAAGVPEERILDVAPWPSAANLARLVAFPVQQALEATFSLEPMYVRASEAERNPKFPPLPGPAPSARLKED